MAKNNSQNTETQVENTDQAQAVLVRLIRRLLRRRLLLRLLRVRTRTFVLSSSSLLCRLSPMRTTR
jgi:hypothetical protein